MGLCISQSTEQPLGSSKSFARVTDAELQLRVCSQPPTETQVSTLLATAQTRAYEAFMTTADSALKAETRPLESKDFSRFLAETKEDAANLFRTMFRQGTPGEGVAFQRIKEVETELMQQCVQDSVMLGYCNTYRSFVLCSAVKKKIVEEDLRSGNINKAKLLKQYDKEAAGEYFTMCRDDLESLIDHLMNDGFDYDSILNLLKKQSVGDREILRKEKHQAEAISRRAVPTLFSTGRSEERPETPNSYLAMQSRLSVIDLIERMREEDGTSPDDFFTLQGQVVAVGPIKKHRSAEDEPLFYPKSAAGTNNGGQKAKQFTLEESTEDSLDFSDPNMYKRGWVDVNSLPKMPV